MMTEPLRTLRTVFSVYRSHCGLLWRIMLPVVIPVYLVTFLWGMRAYIDVIDKITENEFGREGATSSIDTRFGVIPTVLFAKSHISDFIKLPDKVSSEEAIKEPLSDEMIDIQFPPGQRIWTLLPLPVISLTDDEGITTWMWWLSFNRPTASPVDPMTLLLLTFCPLSLCVTHLLRRSDKFGLQQNQLTARKAWRQTGRKVLTLLGVYLIVVFGVYLIGVLTALINIFSDSIMKTPMSVWGIPGVVPDGTWSVWLSTTSFHWFSIALELLFLVAISLYNPCLILEDNRAVVGVLRRSWNLVRDAKWRFIGIYLLTGWIISVIDSVMMGAILWGFSLFISDLAAIQDALSPLKFLTLFIGADIRMLLPQLLSTPVMVAIFGIAVLIQTFLLPIWAILTTYLYLERVDA